MKGEPARVDLFIIGVLRSIKAINKFTKAAHSRSLSGVEILALSEVGMLQMHAIKLDVFFKK